MVFSFRSSALHDAWCVADLGVNQGLFKGILLSLYKKMETETSIKGKVSRSDSGLHSGELGSISNFSTEENFSAVLCGTRQTGRPKFSQAASVLPIFHLSDLGVLIYKSIEILQLQLEIWQFVI